MLRGMYSSVSAMINLQSKQSLITNNIANVNTTGYKSETLVSKTFGEILLSNNDNYIGGQGTTQILGTITQGVSIDETITNHQQGSFISTDNKTDFAIEGSGFFTVQDSTGNLFYTRDGAFKVNSQGYLVTNAGHYVMGNNTQTGNRERILVGNEDIAMDNANNLVLNGNTNYKFAITNFNDTKSLNKVGDNLYYGQGGTTTNNVNIRQGFKEGSNVDIINETAELMSNLRAFEANQKVVQTIDSILNKIANEIGAVR